MKVLLTNHHLADRAGSELYVSELATALRERGHTVGVFTLHPGGVAEQLRRAGVPVWSTDEQHLVRAFAPDVVHAHHAPTLWVVGALGLDCPAIVSALGVLPPLEAPPPSWPGVAFGVAVSDEVKAHLEALPFGQSVPVRVLRNWFDDRGWTPRPARAPGAVRRVGVISNHLAPELARHLDALAAARPGLSWAHLGLPTRSVEVTPALLEGFDLVVTIGRTALLGAAVGRPVLLADHHGSDGLLDVAHFEAQAAVNFSGRARRGALTLEHLTATLDAAATHDVAAVQAKVLADFRLTARAAQWELAYGEAIASGRRLGEAAQREFTPLARQYLLLLEQGRQAEARARQLEAERDALAARVASTEAELAAARAELDAPGVATALRLTGRARVLGRDLAPHGSVRRDLLVRARRLLGD